MVDAVGQGVGVTVAQVDEPGGAPARVRPEQRPQRARAVNRGVRSGGWVPGWGGGLLWPGGELAGRSHPCAAAWNPAEAVLVPHV